MSEGRMWRCKACNTITPEHALLTAVSPFDAEQSLTACPKCKTCDEGFDLLCDEPGCRLAVSCGWPTLDGAYRQTCGLHMERKP